MYLSTCRHDKHNVLGDGWETMNVYEQNQPRNFLVITVEEKYKEEKLRILPSRYSKLNPK